MAISASAWEDHYAGIKTNDKATNAKRPTKFDGLEDSHII
jgi:hypothetical protein